MTTKFISKNEISDVTLAEAGEVLRAGGLVVFPTETVYGLGANALDSSAAEKIYAAKGRPSDNPLIVHIAAPEDAVKYAYTSKKYQLLADAFMPGPITVIMPKRDCIPLTVTGGLDSVGIRCPENGIARRLIAAAKVPVAAPSANISGKPSPTCAEHVKYDLDGKVDVIIDGGNCTFGLESTIVKIEATGEVILLRPGAITLDMLSEVVGEVKLDESILNKPKEDARPLSPGMKYRHYAPSAPLFLLNGTDERRIEYCKTVDNDTLLLIFDEEAELLKGKRFITIGSRDSEVSQANRLFAALREADNVDCKRILAPLPRKSGVALALYNRMIRAAAHNVIDLL